MDNARCCGCLGSLADSPLPDFVGTRREETGQVQYLAHGNDDLWQDRLSRQLFALFLDCGLVPKLGQALLERDRDGNDRITRRFRLDELRDLGKMFVLLADIIPFAEVNQIHDRLGSEEEERVDNLHLERPIKKKKIYY